MVVAGCRPGTTEIKSPLLGSVTLLAGVQTQLLSFPWGPCQKPPQGAAAMALPFSLGASLPRDILAPASQGRTPTEVGTHPWGPRPLLCAWAGTANSIPLLPALLWLWAGLEEAQRG